MREQAGRATTAGLNNALSRLLAVCFGNATTEAVNGNTHLISDVPVAGRIVTFSKAERRGSWL